LSLLIDVSNSINDSEFTLQKQGYASAFRDASVLAGITSGQHGKIAANVVYWSSSSQQAEVVPFTLIDDAASASAFADAIESTTRSFDNLTGIGSAIQYATPRFDTNDFIGTRRVIDVSGDGTNNSGIAPSTARDAALSAGVTTINGLAIGGGGIESYYNQNVKGGADSFVVPVASFSDIAGAVRRKVFIESTGRPNIGQPPRPGDADPLPVDPTKSGLVVVTHGWNGPQDLAASASLLGLRSYGDHNWLEETQAAIQQNATEPRWDVRSERWEFFAGPDPLSAMIGGRVLGHAYGSKLNLDGLTDVHLVAHSAGSWYIQSIAEIIDYRARKDGLDISVHVTFLDAFTPLGGGPLGRTAEYVEHYVDRDVSDGSFFTNLHLSGAVNIDITALDGVAGEPHGDPWRFYRDSAVDPQSQANMAWYGWGFQRSAEYAGVVDLPSGTCQVYLPSGDGNCGEFPSFERLADGNIDLTDPIFSVGYANSTPFTISSASQIGLLQTQSPAYAQFLVDLAGMRNALEFNYEFLSDAEGALSVYLDEDLVFQADERFDFSTLLDQEPLVAWLGRDVEPGLHWLTFRLDPWSEAQSELAFGNVQFVYYEVNGASPPGPQTIPTPAAFGAGGVVLLLMAVRRRRPVSLNVN